MKLKSFHNSMSSNLLLSSIQFHFHPQHHHHLNSCSPKAHQYNSSKGSSLTAQSKLAKHELLNLISDQDRGLKTQKNPAKRDSIINAIDALADLGSDTVTTGTSLSATWRLLWTTEKEQLFIIENAHLFGTQVGEVLQVIDVEQKLLNNVITFPPDGVFFVRSNIEIASPQRVNFRFTSAVLRGKNWEIPLPPFGQGWFESVFLDDEIRVVKDIRGDYLVVDRAPYAWKE
ncbi:probable plastid-lipid-associated protein 11, chloroplastic isoform X2 [Ziziphus jujuba]|uniref:Probable plastid-lipid-associated protein 11, chloroplastic isoform X2 n=1 Tax=Ziziphus jujuba TaxID=326968 RepID=A0A6P6GFR1_ZIZJJ|nr:probable plastid-lipid-associated protein 11, chloroplastic isoform X2 [Ziziphus jujuba]